MRSWRSQPRQIGPDLNDCWGTVANGAFDSATRNGPRPGGLAEAFMVGADFVPIRIEEKPNKLTSKWAITGLFFR